MQEKILIVEDELIVATDLRLLLEEKGFTVCGIARSYEKAVEMIEEVKPDMVLLDIFLTGTLTGIDLAKRLKEENIAFIYLSANANEEILSAAKKTEPYGFIVKPFREKDLLVTLEIARYRHEHSLESTYRREAEFRKQLENIITQPVSWEQKLFETGKILQQYIPFDFLAAGFDDMGETSCRGSCYLRIGFDEYQRFGVNELLTVTRLSMDDLMAIFSGETRETINTVYNDESFENICKQSSLKKLFADTFQMRSNLTAPLPMPGKRPFSFSFYSRRSDAYSTHHLNLLNHLQYILTRSIDSMIINEKTITTPANIKHGGLREINNRSQLSCFEKIIGNSHLLLNVFDYITQVAPMDTSVLILGESGTGKEGIADCIHQLSPRKEKAFIKLNCATLPATLIESELFGHEKGSFTGAIDKRIGKFEQAGEGTILLDEIGEIPLDLQVKLLRVLQEKEIERVGGRVPIKINARIIAATNRNLEKEVAEGRFRLDLYYRLNVFPITLPPLRERKEDIPALIAHFINVYNRKTGKKITGVSEKVSKNLMAYSWPGNIRELEHLMERSVLLTKGTVIEDTTMPTLYRQDKIANSEELNIKSITENEREHILAVLKKSNGRIYGPGGAAELLKIPPTTLSSKIKKLRIKREYRE